MSNTKNDLLNLYKEYEKWLEEKYPAGFAINSNVKIFCRDSLSDFMFWLENYHEEKDVHICNRWCNLGCAGRG